MKPHWFTVEDIALEVSRRHDLPIGVCRRLVELEFLRLQDDVAVIRSHLAQGDRQLVLAAIPGAVAEP